MDTGFIPTWVGPGLRTIAGDGHLSTTEDGFMKVDTDGCGFQETNGRRPGLPGELIVITMVGLH